MKVTALIIATYIFFLTVQPVLPVLAAVQNNVTVECCSSKACANEQPQKKNNKSEQHRPCNPFQVCSLCCGYLVYELTTKSILFNELQSAKIKYIENKKAVFSASFFHPPEIIPLKFVTV